MVNSCNLYMVYIYMYPLYNRLTGIKMGINRRRRFFYRRIYVVVLVMFIYFKSEFMINATCALSALVCIEFMRITFIFST